MNNENNQSYGKQQIINAQNFMHLGCPGLVIKFCGVTFCVDNHSSTAVPTNVLEPNFQFQRSTCRTALRWNGSASHLYANWSQKPGPSAIRPRSARPVWTAAIPKKLLFSCCNLQFEKGYAALLFLFPNESPKPLSLFETLRGAFFQKWLIMNDEVARDDIKVHMASSLNCMVVSSFSFHLMKKDTARG